jgi:hypothetical protein
VSGAVALLVAACGSGSVQGTNFGGSGPAGGASGAGGSAGTPGGGGGGSNPSGTGVGGSGISVVTGDSGTTSTPSCVNLQCNQTTCTAGACTQKACAAGAKTTVSGTVYDPAGKVPLYNVIVYVPNATVLPIVNGASCDKCSAMAVNPVVSALTDTHGHFVLEDAPVGDQVPLVIQVGKWRRQTTISNVAACTETPLTDINQTRLPRNQSEGDIPLIAITTGSADSMECLPRRMGLDDSEFSTEAGTGRIHLYAGMDNGNNARATRQFAPTLNAGATLTPATTVWGDVAHLRAYDILILSCEGALLQNEKPATARQALYDYESLGGRVFASHWHRYWFSDGPMPVPTVGTWRDNNDPPTPIDGTIDTTFPKGVALSDWLVNVGASTTPGTLSILEARDNVQAVNATIAQQWITIQAPAARNVAAHTAIQFLSFNAPLAVPDAMQCGRAVFNDLHVSSTGMDMPGQPFPMGCEVRDLTSQEKAVEFLLFDLSSCVQNDKVPPMPPPVVR